MRIGITGSGQLGWMMILEGRKLGVEFNVAGESPNDPASRIADSFFPYTRMNDFVDSSDFVTFEFEHVPGDVIQYAMDQGKLFPSMESVVLKRDRSREKKFFTDHGIPTAKYYVSDDFTDAIEKSKAFSKSVVKQCFNGYDGKGQALVENGAVLSGSAEGKCIVEEFIDYDFEASIICYRDRHGRVGSFLPSLNFNSFGILLYNESPVNDYGMREISEKLLSSLNYVGVMGIEFFIRNEKAMVNEFSPRVHNSGHHTLMGSSVSQFEQHVRILSDLPTVNPVLYRPSGIVNIIGKMPTNIFDILKGKEAKPYIYGKAERRRRKIGHVNVTAETIDDLHSLIVEIKEGIYGKTLESNLSINPHSSS
ncbi:MAG: 5-(carboxyamino)imidazole ribonucleotide synthase [Candidatus Thermoplasmatota archaeon]|nr:5-(carboxyamino)imidazole ribonucleotide synthase [Candidatus Thermoplasmatota archaeon]